MTHLRINREVAGNILVVICFGLLMAFREETSTITATRALLAALSFALLGLLPKHRATREA